MRVMIVEDEVLIAMSLETMITDYGGEVCVCVRNGAEALAAAAEHKPDFATMDLRLADGECGAEVARELKETLGLRCLFISGNLDRRKIESLQALDPLGFLHKPVYGSDLRKALDAAAGTLAQTRPPEKFVPDGAAAAPEKK